MKMVIWLISLAAIGLALAIAVSGPGTRFGVWDYGTGLTIIRSLAIPVMIAAALALLGFIGALFAARGAAPIALAAVIMAGGAAMVPVKMKQLVDANPFIHDITTDFENPPAIVAGASMKRKNPPEYVGDEIAPGSEMTVAQAQRQSFPDIGPIIVDKNFEDTTKAVQEIIIDMHMTVLNSGARDGSFVIEAAFMSTWYGFVDDFIVRITSEGDKTRVDVRSKSRVGVSDLGANARRVQEFTKLLKAA